MYKYIFQPLQIIMWYSNHSNQGFIPSPFPSADSLLHPPDQVVIPEYPILHHCPVIIFVENIVIVLSFESFSCTSLCLEKDPILKSHGSLQKPDWKPIILFVVHVRYLVAPLQCLDGGWGHHQTDGEAAPHLQGDQVSQEQEAHMS